MTKKQGKKSDYLFKGNLKRFEDKIWKFFFRTERQCFTPFNISNADYKILVNVN